MRYISTQLIGVDFEYNTETMYDANGNVMSFITENDPLYKNCQRTYDLRTGYLCTHFTQNPADPFHDLTWYVNYLYINYMLLCSPAEKKNNASALSLLNIGYIPIGYPPSFTPSFNAKMTMMLEIHKIPYIMYHATVMGNQFYKTNDKDIWVHKLDAAKFLGCAPSEVTSLKLLGGLLHAPTKAA